MYKVKIPSNLHFCDQMNCVRSALLPRVLVFIVATLFLPKSFANLLDLENISANDQIKIYSFQVSDSRGRLELRFIHANSRLALWSAKRLPYRTLFHSGVSSLDEVPEEISDANSTACSRYVAGISAVGVAQKGIVKNSVFRKIDSSCSQESKAKINIAIEEIFSEKKGQTLVDCLKELKFINESAALQKFAQDNVDGIPVKKIQCVDSKKSFFRERDQNSTVLGLSKFILNLGENEVESDLRHELLHATGIKSESLTLLMNRCCSGPKDASACSLAQSFGSQQLKENEVYETKLIEESKGDPDLLNKLMNAFVDGSNDHEPLLQKSCEKDRNSNLCILNRLREGNRKLVDACKLFDVTERCDKLGKDLALQINGQQNSCHPSVPRHSCILPKFKAQHDFSEDKQGEATSAKEVAKQFSDKVDSVSYTPATQVAASDSRINLGDSSKGVEIYDRDQIDGITKRLPGVWDGVKEQVGAFSNRIAHQMVPVQQAGAATLDSKRNDSTVETTILSVNRDGIPTLKFPDGSVGSVSINLSSKASAGLAAAVQEAVAKANVESSVPTAAAANGRQLAVADGKSKSPTDISSAKSNSDSGSGAVDSANGSDFGNGGSSTKGGSRPQVASRASSQATLTTADVRKKLLNSRSPASDLKQMQTSGQLDQLSLKVLYKRQPYGPLDATQTWDLDQLLKVPK
jgi:hypothetical protein